MRKIVFALLATSLISLACAKEESFRDINNEISKELSIEGHYGPHFSELQDPDDEDNTLNGAKCALGQRERCYEATDCYADGTSSFTQVYESLLNSGDILPLEPGEPITHPLLLEALRTDGLPLN